MRYTLTMEKRLPVDWFMKLNKELYEEPEYKSENAIDFTLSFDDFDILHGINYSDFKINKNNT